MRSPSPGGFLGLGNTLRSLTLSPMNSAIQQAHRMARQRLEAGGAAAAVVEKAKPSPQVGGDYYLPADVNPEEIDREIRSKLSGVGTMGSGELKLLEQRAGGRVVVPARHLLQLGDGRFDKGREFMHGLVKQIRARRWARLAQRRAATHLH